MDDLREKLCSAIGDSTRVDDALAVFKEWLEKEGLAVVPKTPTDKMHYAGATERRVQDWMNETKQVVLNTSDIWTAMVKAAPSLTKDSDT